MASKVSFPVPCRTSWTAPPYMSSKPRATPGPAAGRRLKPLMLAMATAGARPASDRGSVGVRETARNGVASGSGVHWRCRFIQPSSVDFTPGVPLSMKSWASKWERVVSGLPTAWTTARLPSWNDGRSGASAGWRPKWPSRSSAASLSAPRGAGIAMVGRICR